MGHSGLELRIPPQVCGKTCKESSDLSLQSSVMSPHPAQASGPGCGPSLSLAGGPASGWSGGRFLPQLTAPPSQDLGSVKDQVRDSTSFVGWKLCLWNGPGVLFGPKWELKCPGSCLPPRGELGPCRWQVLSCMSLFSPRFHPQERLPRPACCPQALQVPSVLPSFLPSMEVWWGGCVCLT